MSKKETNYEIGDKFILTISEKYKPTESELPREDSPSTLYRMNGFKSLVFDSEGLKKLKPYKPLDIEAIRDDAYHAGAKEAWGTAKLIACVESDGGMSSDELEEAFGTHWADDILGDYSFMDARDKIDAYLAKKKAEEEKARLEAIQSEGSQADGADAFKPGDIVRNVATGALAVVAAVPEFGGVTVVEKGGIICAAVNQYTWAGKNAFDALGVKSDA